MTGVQTCALPILPAGQLAAPVLAAIGTRKTVTLGIRPQRVRIGGAGLKGKLTSNQWLGDQCHVAAEFAGKLMIAVMPGKVSARAGDTVNFAFSGNDLHLFDSATGAAISHGMEAA